MTPGRLVYRSDDSRKQQWAGEWEVRRQTVSQELSRKGEKTEQWLKGEGTSFHVLSQANVPSLHTSLWQPVHRHHCHSVVSLKARGGTHLRAVLRYLTRSGTQQTVDTFDDDDSDDDDEDDIDCCRSGSLLFWGVKEQTP